MDSRRLVRLRRALEQLRGRMDRRCGRAWALMLLPVLDTRSLAATTGAAIMGKKNLFLCRNAIRIQSRTFWGLRHAMSRHSVALGQQVLSNA